MMAEDSILDGRPVDEDRAVTTSELDQAYQACRDRGFAMALQITGDAEEAADLVQEAYLRARRGLGGYRKECALRSWLLRIVVNLALKHVRRQQVRRRLRYLVPSWPKPRRPADWLVGGGEQLRQLAGALDKLPGKQRAAFVLRHAHGLPVAEVAGLMDLSPSTVKTHLLRATERLRRELAAPRSPRRSRRRP